MNALYFEKSDLPIKFLSPKAIKKEKYIVCNLCKKRCLKIFSHEINVPCWTQEKLLLGNEEIANTKLLKIKKFNVCYGCSELLADFWENENERMEINYD